MSRFSMALAFCAATAATFPVVVADEPDVRRAADLASPVPITVAGTPIDVEGFAAPFMGDFDEDGKSDLLVGQCQAGRLRIYRNVGTNARPKFDQFEWFTTTGGVAGVPICCRVAFTPQLIDFDGDGRTDVLTGGGLGRLYIFRRNKDGTFAEAEVLENKHGELQMGRHFPSGSRITYNATVFGHDWDDDGDVDLLFGCYSNCLIENEGTRRSPVFGEAVPLMLGDKQIPPGNVVGLCVADWDGDGRADLLAGRRGDVVWYRNTGEKGSVELQEPEILVPAGDWSFEGERRDDQPARFHGICVTDFNADGRLDLLLGDHFIKRVDLTEERETQVTEGMAKSSKMRRELATAPANETRPERIQRFRKALREWQEYAELPLGFCQAASPRFERSGRVWLYERIAGQTNERPTAETKVMKAVVLDRDDAATRAGESKIVSSFDADAEGWNVRGGQKSHQQDDGDHGGHLQIADGDSSNMTIVAPERFVGDLSRFEGGMLSFDAREIEAPGGRPFPQFGVVTITGGNWEARVDLAPGPASRAWNTYSIPLIAADWNVEPATWRKVLSDVRAITVSIESCTPVVETVGFDDFRLCTRPDMITPGEFQRLDLNGDGKLNADEFPERLSGYWKYIDTNHDGWVDGFEVKRDRAAIPDE